MFRSLIHLTFALLFLCAGNPVLSQIPPVYDDDDLDPVPVPKTSGPVIYNIGNKYGLSIADTVVVQAIYDYMSFLNDTMFAVKSGDQYGVINELGEVVIPLKYDTLGHAKFIGQGLIIGKKGLLGSLDDKGTPYLPVEYKKILYTHPGNNIALVEDQKGNVQLLLDRKVYEGPLEEIMIYPNGVIAKQEGYYGFLSEGNVTIPFEYDGLQFDPKYPSNHDKKSLEKKGYTIIGARFQLLTTRKENHYGLIDVKGRVLYETNNEKVHNSTRRNLVMVSRDKKWGAYFVRSGVKMDVIYDQILTDGNQFLNLTLNGKQGIVDYEGNVIMDFEYDKIQIQGMNQAFMARKDSKAGWYDAQGNNVIPPIYDEIDDYRDDQFRGLYKVRKGGYFGVIDTHKVVIPLQFSGIYTMDHFFEVMNEEEKMGLYDAKGKELLPAEYDNIYDTDTRDSPLILTRKGGLIGAIMNDGTRVLKEEYTKVGFVLNNFDFLNSGSENGLYLMAVKHKNGKYGILDQFGGELIIPPEYDEVLQKLETPKTTYLVVRKGDKYGIVNHSNTIIAPFIFDWISLSNVVYRSSMRDVNLIFAAKKRGKYGAVNLGRGVCIPFFFDDIAKVSFDDIYKVKEEGHYVLMNSRGDIIHPGPFDDVAQFEGEYAMTFFQERMRVITSSGRFTTDPIRMIPHEGYSTFDDVKLALVEALDSDDSTALENFARKIAPSKHLLYLLSDNPEIPKWADPEEAVDKYTSLLLKFKREGWERGYEKRRLLEVNDYTGHRKRGVRNWRTEDHGYGSTEMERLLRSSYKVNGYWISRYFTTRQYQQQSF